MALMAGSYFVLMAVIFVATSQLGRRRTHSFQDYAVAGRAVGGMVNGLGGMASYLSAFLFMGMTGAVWKIGFPFMGILVPFALSIAMFMALVGPYARNTGAHTLMEFLELRFGKVAAYCGLAINLLFVGMFMLGQMKALGVCVEHITGLDYRTAVLVGGVVLTVYCVLGGMFGISWNQCVQGVIMLAGIVLPLAFVLRSLGVHAWWDPFFGYGSLAPALEKRGFFELGKDTRYYVSLILPGLGGAAAAPQVFAIAARARNEQSARWALSWMVFWIGLVYSCAMAFAFAATYWVQQNGVAVDKGQADYLLFRLCEATTHPALAALIVAGALAASFSTMAALLIFCGTVAVRYVYAPVKLRLRKGTDVTEAERRRVMAVAMALAGVASVLLAWRPPALLVVPIIWGWEILSCTLFIPCLLAVWWKRATRWGTIASMAVGMGVVLTQGWTGPVVKLPFYGSLLVLPLACLAHIAVSCLTPPDPERTQVDRWHGHPEADETRYNSVVLPVLLSASSLALLLLAVL